MFDSLRAHLAQETRCGPEACAWRAGCDESLFLMAKALVRTVSKYMEIVCLASSWITAYIPAISVRDEGIILLRWNEVASLQDLVAELLRQARTQTGTPCTDLLSPTVTYCRILQF